MIIISKHATVLTDEVDNDDEIREALAAIQHEIWAHWMRYLFSKTLPTMDDDEMIASEHAERWRRQMETPYDELSEQEKESDRDQADKIMAFLYGQRE